MTAPTPRDVRLEAFANASQDDALDMVNYEWDDIQTDLRAALTRREPLDVEVLAEWLDSSEGRVNDIFDLWVQGKRTSQWVAERLLAEGHLARLEAER